MTAILDINPDGGWVMALSVGGSCIRAAAMNLAGELQEQIEHKFEYISGEESVTPAVLSALSGLIARRKRKYGSPLAIGISTTGIVDEALGIVRVSFNLQLKDYPIARIVRESCDIPCVVTNDVICSTLAELKFGQGREQSSFAYVLADVGVGAGLVFDGEVRRLPFGAEFGLMVVARKGDPGRFGGRGYLESLASGRGVVAEARKRLEQGKVSLLTDTVPDGPGHITIADVVDAARRGDELCTDILAHAAGHLGVGIVNHAHTLGLGVFVVDGGLTEAGDAFWGPLRKAVERHEYLPGTVRIVPSLLKGDATLLGAGTLALDSAFSELSSAG